MHPVAWQSVQLRLICTWSQATCLHSLRSAHIAGRIFEFVHGSGANPPVITPANLPPIVETLLISIKDEHHIAEKVGTPLLSLLPAAPGISA
jgi:hypothetical protein